MDSGSFFLNDLEVSQVPFINRLKVISKKDMDWIHTASLKILEETGVVFHSEEALEICKRKGAKVNGKIAYFPPKMVSQALEYAPETFRWQARNDAYSVTVGDEQEKLLFLKAGKQTLIKMEILHHLRTYLRTKC